MNAIHATVSSENWDDDFEFQQNNNNNNANQNIHFGRSPSTTSHFSEDWDRGHDHEQHNQLQGTRPSTTTILEDKKNLYAYPITTTAPLAEWAESGPSTPTKRPTSHSTTNTTENWDDDFEDGMDSPVRRPKKGSVHPHGHTVDSPLKTRSRSRSHPHSRLRYPKRHQERDPEAESWDDEFDLGPNPTSFPPTTPDLSPTKRTRHDAYSSSEDENHTDDDADFGFADKEEDRTVTARSRRAALSRLTSSSSGSPPPPVPALPASLALSGNPTSLCSMGMGEADLTPFPRSPTASVFSVPTSGRDSVAFSYYTSNSTTHLNRLRPSLSRTSVGGFANLPPSPPIHKERERRRLRKKSRPPAEAVFELSVRNARPLIESAGSGASGAEDDVPMSPIAPSTPPPITSPEPHSPPSGGLPMPSPSHSGKTALLSRIGSVKKWGVRKKRPSSTPSEVVLQEAETDKDRVPGIYPDSEHDLTPRPPSSLSASSPAPNSKPYGSGWFFRATGGAGGGGSPPSVANANPSSDSLSKRERGTMYTPTPGSRVDDGEGAVMDSPSKLVKRKSFGFVQIRRGNPPSSGVDQNEGGGSVGGKRPMSMQPQSPYAGLGHGLTGVAMSVEDLTDRERDRKRSFSRSRERPKDPEKEKTAGREKAKEGTRGFIGNVRKISLVGRHKRTKSNASPALVGEGICGMDTGADGSAVPLPVVERLVLQREGVGVDVDVEMEMEMDVDQTKTPSRSQILLPPIELQPPSPPRVLDTDVMKTSTPETTSNGAEISLLPLSKANLTSPPSVTSPARKSPSPTKIPASPQSASLGRSTAAPGVSGGGIGGGNGIGAGSTAMLRRNSLGDLKIPARITQAQVGLKRDLGMVREFAANVEQLKELQSTYHTLVLEVQTILDNHAHTYIQQSPSRATSPSFFNLSRPLSRPRSNTNPTANDPPAPQLAYKQLASAFYTINSKYRISWECAELLIELGSGTAGTTATTAPPTSVSAPAMHSGGSIDGKKSRERAITLAGDEARSKPPTPTPGSSGGVNTDPSPPLASPPSLSWRASTGRHDLSQRQLVLLKEMLNNPDSSFVVEDLKAPIPEEVVGLSVISVNRDWRWGDAMNSTVTLPSEESASGQRGSGAGSPSKKRRRSRLGMSGLRDVLRSLKRSHSHNPPLPTPPIPVSSASLTTDSSVDSQNRPHEYDHPLVPPQGRRRTKTSTGPESMRFNTQRERDLRPTSPYNPLSSANKASPRRPSLASIFRIGQKSKTTPPTSSLATNGAMDSVGDNMQTALGRESSSTGEEEDWDRMDSASDLDAAAKALGVRDGSATVRGIRGRSPYLQEHSLLPGCPSRLTTPKRSASASQSSIWGESSSSTAAPPSRSTRLSNVEESVNDHPGPHLASKGKLTKTGLSPPRPPSRTRKDGKTGSVRSMPPYSFTGLLPDLQLVMTPENIKPLLENAKEVHARLDECIREIRLLLTASN